MVPGFDPTLILVLNLVGTFVFGLSGGLAGVRARLDLLGVVVLSAFVVGLAGGSSGTCSSASRPPRSGTGRYLAAAGAAGLLSFAPRSHARRGVDACSCLRRAGSGVVLRHRSQRRPDHHLGVAPAIILGAITGIGGGMTP